VPVDCPGRCTVHIARDTATFQLQVYTENNNYIKDDRHAPLTDQSY